MFNFSVPITKDYILSKITEEDIFERYLGIKPELSTMFCNPLREDDSPGANFNINRHERLIFYDPGGGFTWDCFNVVEYLEKCTFKEALHIIANDFGLTNGNKSNPAAKRAIRAKEKIELRIKVRDWNKEDKLFWHTKYYQTRDDLKFLDIFPVSHVWYLRSGMLELFYTYREGDPAYAYWFGGNDFKIYFPKREKGNKFRQNRGDIIQGLNKLPPKGEFLIHTKGFKDVACIRKFRKFIDVSSIAAMSETQVIPELIMKDLKQRFTYHFTLFDLDHAGILLMKKYKKAYDVPYLTFGRQLKKEGVKDFSDHLDIKRFDATLEMMKDVYNLII